MKEHLLNLFDFSKNSKKELWFAAIFAAWTIGFWVLGLRAFVTKTIDPAPLLSLLGAGIVWITFVALADVLLPKNLIKITGGVLILVLFILFGFRDLNMLGIGLLAVALWAAHKRADHIKGFTAKFSPALIYRRFLPVFFTGLAIFLAFSYNSFILEDYAENPRVSPDVYHVLFMPVETTLDLAIPGYEKEMTVEQFLEVFLQSFASRFFPEQLTGTDISAVPIFDEETGSQTLEEFTFRWVDSNIQQVVGTGPGKELLPAFFIVGLFFIFKFLLWPITWITIGLLWLAIKVLSLYNIITFKEITIVKEVPTLGLP